MLFLLSFYYFCCPFIIFDVLLLFMVDVLLYFFVKTPLTLYPIYIK